LFTGRRVDILDNGSLKIQYNRNRYYDYYTGRWLTHDPLGINPAGGMANPFAIIDQYRGGLNLYQYTGGNPVMETDALGFLECPDCNCKSGLLTEGPTSGIGAGFWGDLGSISASLHFFSGGGSPKIFTHESKFSKWVAASRGVRHGIRLGFRSLEEKAKKLVVTKPSLSCTPATITGFAGGYWYDEEDEWKGFATLGSGTGNDPYSNFTFRAKCCLKRACCIRGNLDVNIECKVRFKLKDKYSYDAYLGAVPIIGWGTPFWTTVYFYKDFGPKDITIGCK